MVSRTPKSKFGRQSYGLGKLVKKQGSCRNAATLTRYIVTSRHSGLVLGRFSAHFQPIIEGFKASNPRNTKRTNLWVSGTKSFEDEQFEEEEGRLKRRFGAFIIQLVYLFPFLCFPSLLWLYLSPS